MHCLPQDRSSGFRSALYLPQRSESSLCGAPGTAHLDLRVDHGQQIVDLVDELSLRSACHLDSLPVEAPAFNNRTVVGPDSAQN